MSHSRGPIHSEERQHSTSRTGDPRNDLGHRNVDTRSDHQANRSSGVRGDSNRASNVRGESTREESSHRARDPRGEPTQNGDVRGNPRRSDNRHRDGGSDEHEQRNGGARDGQRHRRTARDDPRVTTQIHGVQGVDGQTRHTAHGVSDGEGRRRGRREHDEDPEDDDERYRDDRYVVPAMPMAVAVVCCVLNFIIPGFGSMLAGCCVHCCARTDGMTAGEKWGSCCTVFGIGILQLLLTVCFLIGWIWSCIWGITFIGMSVEYYYGEEDEEENGNEDRRRRRHQDEANPDNRQPERRADSRRQWRAANLIYPMRARSNVDYNTPPPPYRMYDTPPPRYSSLTGNQSPGRARSNLSPGRGSPRESPPVGTPRLTGHAPASAGTPRSGHNSAAGTGSLVDQVIAEEPQEVEVSACTVCSNEFESGRRKFQCRNCSEIVCGECYTKTVSIRNTRVKVCDKCYDDVMRGSA